MVQFKGKHPMCNSLGCSQGKRTIEWPVEQRTELGVEWAVWMTWGTAYCITMWIAWSCSQCCSLGCSHLLNSLVNSNHLWNDLRNDLVTRSFKDSRVLHRICMLLIYLLNTLRNSYVIAIHQAIHQVSYSSDSRVLESPIEKAIQRFTQPIELHG